MPQDVVRDAGHDGHRQEDGIEGHHVAGEGIAVAEAVLEVARQVVCIPQDVDKVTGAVGVVDGIVLNVRISVLCD
jgi:hypothetical protein